MDFETIQAMVRRLNGARLVSANALSGGGSAAMMLLEIAFPKGVQGRLILRCYGDEKGAEKVNFESALLRHLGASGLPVAGVRLVDGRCVLLDFIDGEAIFKPDNRADFIEKSAVMLAQIHGHEGVDATQKWVSRRPDFDVSRGLKSGQNRADIMLEKRIMAALKAHWPPPKRNQSTLLHGDLWAGNLIWKGAEIVGVIDWEDAMWDDPLCDLAISRLEFALAFGDDAAQIFTEAYRQAARVPVDFDGLVLWDLRAALRPFGYISAWAAGWSDLTADVMRERHLNFALAALDRL